MRQGGIRFRPKGKGCSVLDEHILVLHPEGAHVRVGEVHSPIQFNNSGESSSTLRITIVRVGKHYGSGIGTVADRQGAGAAELQVHRQRSAASAQGPAPIRGPAGKQAGRSPCSQIHLSQCADGQVSEAVQAGNRRLVFQQHERSGRRLVQLSGNSGKTSAFHSQGSGGIQRPDSLPESPGGRGAHHPPFYPGCPGKTVISVL